MITRRGIITGLISLAAAPAIVRASSLMQCSPTEELYSLGHVNVNVGVIWEPKTPEEILDDVRRMLAAAWQVPERMLIGPTATTRAEQADLENYYHFLKSETKRVS